MSTSAKPNAARPPAGAIKKSKRDPNSPAMVKLREQVVYDDPKRWDKDLKTGKGEEW